jgi:hypothetical protein
MRAFLVLLALATLACGPYPIDPDPAADPRAARPGGCYAVQLTGQVAPDVSLPELIELSSEAAPGFVTPGRLAVREPASASPRAPISWWIPQGSQKLDLVLGGGYTGYSFSLGAARGGAWVGEGAYFADFGVEPTPGPLTLRLTPIGCP